MASYKQSDYEALRRRCVELRQAGWKQNAIAQAFGLTQGWVSRTLTKYSLQGATALQEGKRTGAPARLSSEQLAELVSQLNKGPEYHGFQGAIWTRPRVNEVIKACFGVSYDPSQVGAFAEEGRMDTPEASDKSPPTGCPSCGSLAAGTSTRT